MLNLSKATFHRANKFQIFICRFYRFFTEHKGSMKVEKRVKGKVVCNAKRIRFTARQKVDLINEWDEEIPKRKQRPPQAHQEQKKRK